MDIKFDERGLPILPETDNPWILSCLGCLGVYLMYLVGLVMILGIPCWIAHWLYCKYF